MVCVKVTFILFCCVFKAYTSNANETEQYAPHISAILKHLNSNPNKIYDYKKGIFINSQQKADIWELTIDVDVSCIVKYPGVPCTEQVLTCNGFVQYSEGEYRVLSDVLCNPKQESSIEYMNDGSTIPTRAQYDSKIQLSHEAVPSDQNADFIAVKPDTAPCVGCPFDLNTNVEGVSSLIDSALRHIETEKTQKHTAIKVIRLQQQVVAGIKYVLTLEVAPTICQKQVDLYSNCPLDVSKGSAVCEIIFIQRPWVSKEKLIIGNNCTASQEYPPDSIRNQRNDMSNEINTNSDVHTNKIEEMDGERLADLESQIFVESENTKPTASKNKIKANAYPNKVQYEEVIGNPSNNQLYTTYKMKNTNYEPVAVTESTEQPKTATEKTIDNESSNGESRDTSISENRQLDTTETSLDENKKEETNKDQNDDIHLQENKRLKRELDDSDSKSSESKEDDNTRERRDLDNSNSDSSESQEDKTSEAIRLKRNTINSSNRFKRKTDDDSKSDSDSNESSESHEHNKTDSVTEESSKLKKKQDSGDSDSDSSESHEDEAIRPKRNIENEDNTSESESKESSETHENDTEESHHRHRRDLENSDSDSSESKEDKTGESIRAKRDATFIDNIRVRRKNDDNSSDSSSSSSSSDSKTDEKNSNKDNNSSSNSSSEDKSREGNQINHESNNNGNDSSSSSSSDDESKEKNKKSHENGQDDDSSSSSSSSEDSSREENRVKHNSDDVNVEVRINKVKRSVGQLEKITQEEKFLVRDLADFAAFSLDNIDDDDHKRVILQILSAKKLKLDGIYYHIILRLGISQCSENEDDENCREKLFPNLTKICKVLVHVEDDLTNPKVVKSQCQNTKKDDRDRNRTNYSRYRRDILVGAPADIPLDDPRVLEFTKDTLNELDAQSEHPNRHKVNKIVSATSQVVAGSKYKIKVIISLSDCLKTDTKPLEECDFPKNTVLKTCDIVVWDRPWLNLRKTTVKCDDSNKEYYFENKNRNKRSYSNQIVFDKDESERSNIKESAKNLGGIEEQSPDNLKASKYLKDILAYLDNESGHYNKLKVQDIISVDKQVVAGELWRIKATVTLSDCPQNKSVDPQNCKELQGSESRTCVFKIWDRPWLPHGKEVQTTCENESEPYSFRLKRSLGSPKYTIPGSLDDTNEPNPKILHYVKSGLQYLDSQSPHSTKYTVKNIKKVSKQVVAGQLWRITAEVVLSDCPKQYYTEYCEELEGSESKICYFTIWEQSWVLNGLQINITCEKDDNLYSFSPKNTQHINTLYNQELLDKFNDFKTKYNKVYFGDTEHNHRFKVFKDNLNTIRLLNKYEQGTARYDITQFADLTASEFSKSHGLRKDLHSENEAPFSNAVIPSIEIPTAFDWRQKGAVTKVKDQGMCGSCWAFSTTGNVEGQYAIKYGKLLEFSEQELVDCDKLDDGCNGGLMDNAYRAIEKLGGLETESDYPYEGDDEKCHFNKTEAKVQLSGALNISHNEVDMAKWLVKNGPISIAINANAMQFYVGGVSHPWKMLCNPKNLDHGVLIVGYGIDNFPKFNKTLPFWIVKNSWGTSWGEQGYYRVYRGDGTCGLNQTPSSAIVA